MHQLSRRLAAAGLVLLLPALMLICIGVGTLPLAPGEVLRALFVDDGSTARLLVFELRLPRVLCAIMVGASLAVSGCLLQAVMRNHMASPSTVGVTGGASLAAYLTLVALPQHAALLPIGAIAGALAATLIIYTLACRRGAGPAKMILSGLAVSALCGAASDMIRLLFAERLANAAGFLVGGFNGCLWPAAARITPYALLGIPAALCLAGRLDLLMLGDASARSLGLRTAPTRLILILLASMLAGASVATAGLLGFVGLIVPHIARLLVGVEHRRLLPASACLGGCLVTLCDTVGRMLLPAGEIPAGVLLALLGAPFFLWLIRRRDGGEG